MRSRSPVAQTIDITLDGLRQLHHRVDRQQLEPNDWPVVGALVSKLIARTEATQERVLAKLGAATAQNTGAASDHDDDHAGHAGVSNPNASSSDANATDPANAGHADGGAVTPPAGPADGVDDPPTDSADGDSTGQPESKKTAKGHGRNGADAYVNAKHYFHALMLGIIGAVCDACGVGRFCRYREKIVVRIVGQPLFGAETHHLEQARCKICGRVIRADGPAALLDGVGSSYIVYDWSACAMLLVMHYFAGAPFKRLESLHAGWGVPLADANQWHMVDTSDDRLLPLYRALELHGIQQATTLRIDDTGSKVIALRRRIQAEIAALELLGESTNDVRTGINATGVYLETPDGTTILFYTGRHHAGEIIDAILKHRRSSSPKLAKVTDGASKNFDHHHEDKLIEATCNAHAFLKFRDIRDKFPAEYALAGEVYAKVFDNDDVAKARALTPIDRMHFHQEHSRPLMEKLRAMCQAKLENRLVEPRSPLWEPLTFIINQWPRLIRFCEEPGVPLDTNLVEQTLIIPVRYLAGSFNYQTETGAEVGDRAMSLIATARANDVEPVAYFTECLRNHADLAERPAYYLPWVYRQRMSEREKPPDPTFASLTANPSAAAPRMPQPLPATFFPKNADVGTNLRSHALA